MAIPLRMTLFWRAVSLIDRTSAATLTPQNVRAASERRKRLAALPGMTMFLGRTHPAAVAVDRIAELPDGTSLPVRVYRPHGTSGERLAVVMNFTAAAGCPATRGSRNGGAARWR